MTHRKKGNQKIWLGVGLLLVIFAGGIFYIRNIKTVSFSFPETIGVYKLNKKTINIEEKCDTLQSHSDTKDIPGKVCQKNATADYRDSATQKVVFVHVIQITEGKEPFIEAIKKLTTPENLGDYNVIRMEKDEIGWFPKESFDLVSTKEGTYIPNQNGGESFAYDEKATGTNEVTQYFISKYTPGVWFSNQAPVKIKSCPDEKIVNRMPGTSPQSSYYIKNGERKELSDYDDGWVKANCTVPEQIVY